MSNLLLDELAQTEARARDLRRQIAAGPCHQYGHDWTCIGGCNAGCSDDCVCSSPVHECSKCGDCDYGENEERDAILADCALERHNANSTTSVGISYRLSST